MTSPHRTLHSNALSALVLLIAFLVGDVGVSQSPDQLVVPKYAVAELQRFAARPKFVPESSGLYTGIASEADRRAAQAAIDGLALRLSQGIIAHPDKAFVLDEIAKALPAFDALDSEDKDQALEYVEELMSDVGLQESDGLLNRWRYGFDPNNPTTK